MPGIAVAGVAGQTQIRLRGARANHVLVVVDGIEVSDPFAGDFDVGTLQAEPGARVEVLRGQQSALYGPDAICGAVAYESASGRARPGFAARIEGGTDNTINSALRYGANGDNWDAALSAFVVSTDGQPNARGGVRDIGRDSYTLAGEGSIDVSGALTLRAAARLIRTEGDRFKASYVSALAVADAHNLTFAADDEVEGVRNATPGGLVFGERREIEQVGLVGEYRYSGAAFDVSAAIRHDINDLFQEATTFRVGAGYRIADGTRLRAAAGSGVKNPGFFELYGFVDGRLIGNAALRSSLPPRSAAQW